MKQLMVANITANKKHLFPMLEWAYDNIYMPAFPIDDERESLEKIKSSIENPKPGVRIAVNILGEKLDDPDHAVIKGISIAYYYVKYNVGLLAYNAISPEHREKGMGKLMIQSRIDTLKDLAQQEGKQLGAVFIEVNDPSCVSAAEDSMNPADRVAIFTSFGAKRIPVPYVQPPVEKDGAYCETLMLMNYPLDGHYAGKRDVEGFMRGIFEELLPDQNPDNNFFFARMKKELDDWTYDLPSEKQTPGYSIGVPEYKRV